MNVCFGGVLMLLMAAVCFPFIYFLFDEAWELHSKVPVTEAQVVAAVIALLLIARAGAQLPPSPEPPAPPLAPVDWGNSESVASFSAPPSPPPLDSLIYSIDTLDLPFTCLYLKRDLARLKTDSDRSSRIRLVLKVHLLTTRTPLTMFPR